MLTPFFLNNLTAQAHHREDVRLLRQDLTGHPPYIYLDGAAAYTGERQHSCLAGAGYLIRTRRAVCVQLPTGLFPEPDTVIPL